MIFENLEKLELWLNIAKQMKTNGFSQNFENFQAQNCGRTKLYNSFKFAQMFPRMALLK